MLFDVRLPIGLLFVLMGLLIAGVGLTGDPKALEAHSAGVNVDLIWGALMAAFGAVMLLLAWRRRRAAPPSAEPD